jgi:hypothetical protein
MEGIVRGIPAGANRNRRKPTAGYFNLPPRRRRPTMRRMFDTIKAELTVAADKLAHLRRFL